MTNSKSLDPIKTLFFNIEKKEYPFLKKILVETKSDLEPKIQKEEIQKFIDENPNTEHFTISAKNGNNIDELLLKIYNEVNSPEKDSIPINKTQKCNVDDVPRDQIKSELSIILLGDSGVGKTNFLTRFTKNVFLQIFLSSQGVNQESKIYRINNMYNYKFTLWDTAGQEKYKSISRQYYKKADGILLLFDVNDMGTFDNVNMWINEIYENSEKIINKEGEGEKKESDIVIYLIGNKVDFAQNDEKEIEKVKEDNIDDNKEDNIDDKKRGMVTKKEKEELTEKLGVKYYEISCKWNLNIEEVMARIVLDCIKLNREKKNRIKLQNANLPPQKEGCCGGGGKGNKKGNKPIKKNKKYKK